MATFSRLEDIQVQSNLYLALDLAYITQPTFDQLNGLLVEVSKMTLVLAQHLRKSKL